MNNHGHLDLPGVFTVTSGLMLLVYALTSAQNFEFAALRTDLLLALSIAAFGHILVYRMAFKIPSDAFGSS
jgi:nitric oxide reductase large subunit